MAKQLTAPGCKYSIVARVDTTIYSPDQKWTLDVPAGQTDFIAETNEIIIPGDAMLCPKSHQTDADLARFNVLGTGSGSLATFVTRAIEQIVGKGNAKVEYGDGKLAVVLTLDMTDEQLAAVENLLRSVLPKDVAEEIFYTPMGYTRLEFLESPYTVIQNSPARFDLGIFTYSIENGDTLRIQTKHRVTRIPTERNGYAGKEGFSSNKHVFQVALEGHTRAHADTPSSNNTTIIENYVAIYDGPASGYDRALFIPGLKLDLDWHVLDAFMSKETLSFALDSNKVSVVPWEYPSNTSQMLTCFGTGPNSNGGTWPLLGQKKEFKFWLNDALQRYLIPVLDQTGVPCMLDLVSRKPFYNQDTGSDFIAGMTMDQARYLANLPATGGSLTVSLPLEAAFDGKVQSVLTTAADKGWTITVQYRESELTTEHIEADFLESTGTQYINTGIIPDNLTGQRCEYWSTVNSSDSHVAGLNEKPNYIHLPDLRSNGGSYSSGYSWGAWVRKGVLRDTCRTVGSLNFLNDSKAIMSSELLNFNDSLPEMPFTPTLQIYLFGTHRADIAHANPFFGKVYNFQISQGDKLVLDYIPALDQAGVPCMHDTISGQNFYNQGTGSFIVGFDTTEKAAVSLSKLPFTTGGTLTVSLPAEAQDTSTLVPAAIDIAKSRGWTIITQYRTN